MKKILLIDDEKGFTTMLRLNLESTGRYDVFTVNDPSTAVKEAAVIQPDIIFLDIIMPDMEGPDVAIQIKNHPFLKDVPIVFLTATVTLDDVSLEGGRIAGHEFLPKPAPVNDIIASVERLVES
ncbi:MAG: CheY-like chemotaxis protein [Lysobacterales bacterium]|jgi:CheY-like chemotaxis protein